MLNKKYIIDEINKSCGVFFSESSFYLHPSSVNRFRISGDYSSKAINNYNGYHEEVNVIKWFDFFWIYIDIRFEDNNTFISLSVFQGDASTSIKHQLFRAEWDDYNNADEKHPQPHWHITSNQAIERTFEEIANLDDENAFSALLNEEKSKIVEVDKMHFAMIGNWHNDDSHIHSLNQDDKVIKWFQGLLGHLKIQLEHVNNNRY